MKRLIAIALIIPALLLLCVGCSRGSYSVISGSSISKAGEFSMKYRRFDGWRIKTLSTGDDPVTLNIAITNNEGTLAVSVTEKDSGELLFNEDAIESGEWTVELPANSNIEIKVTAERHSGSYRFTW